MQLSLNSEGQDIAFPKIAIRGLLLMNESQISCSTVDRKREGLNDVTYFVSQFTGISATNIIVAEGISSNMRGSKLCPKEPHQQTIVRI